MQDMSKQEATRLADALRRCADIDFDGDFGAAAALLDRWPDGEPVGPIYCVGNKTSHAYFWRRSDADAFAASAGAAVGLHVWEVQVMGRPPAESERIAALEAALEQARVAMKALRSVDAHSALTEDDADTINANLDAALRAIEEVRRG